MPSSFPGVRLKTTTRSKSRTARIASRCERAWIPAPRIASVRASARASRRVATPETAAVRTAVRNVLEQTPPELSSDIIDKGMVMTGGGSLLRNIDALLTQVTGIPCHVADNALNSVAVGTGMALEHFDQFRKSLVRGS